VSEPHDYSVCLGNVDNLTRTGIFDPAANAADGSSASVPCGLTRQQVASDRRLWRYEAQHHQPSSLFLLGRMNIRMVGLVVLSVSQLQERAAGAPMEAPALRRSSGIHPAGASHG